MALLPISLSVTRDPYGNRASRSLTKTVNESEIRSSVFERDKNTCRFCGFTAGKYQQLRFLNGNKSDFRLNNLVTACIFCDQCFALERVASMRAGTLIWLPEFGQAALHHLCRAIYVARISPGSMADAARLALDVLLLRKDEAKQRLGTDDPAILAIALQDHLEDEDYRLRTSKLEGIRLLPLDRRIIREADMEFNQFPQILASWRSKDGPFSGELPPTWAESFQKIADAA